MSEPTSQNSEWCGLHDGVPEGFGTLSPPAGPEGDGTEPACALYLQPDLASVIAVAQITHGAWRTALPIPADPALRGATMTLQAIVTPSALPSGFDLTNGLFATFGR
jgi:hypothetical protein